MDTKHLYNEILSENLKVAQGDFLEEAKPVICKLVHPNEFRYEPKCISRVINEPIAREGPLGKRVVFVGGNSKDFTCVVENNTVLKGQEKVSFRVIPKSERNQTSETIQSVLASTPEIVANDNKTIMALEMAYRAAQKDITILLLGETGIGKEVFAKFIHQNSSRSDKSFVAVNCGTLPSELVGSELFGYDEGAFTGAKKNGKKGLFELANQGTIYLDEIGDASLDVQVQLLRVLQERKLRHIGGSCDIKIDVRIIAATNRNLDEMVANGQFRKDLFYRLSVVPIMINPLRERKFDIPLLAQRFLHELNSQYKLHKYFSRLAMQALNKYDWPGNIRELRNVVERAVVFSTNDEITEEDLIIKTGFEVQAPKFKESQPHEKMNLREIIEEFEYQAISEAYQRFGNVRKAASYLCMDTSTLVRKRQKYEEHHKNQKA